MSATNLKTAATIPATISDADFKALVGTTVATVQSIGAKLEEVRQSSESVVLNWLPVYSMGTNYNTGKADIKGFCQKIYDNFGELLVAQDKNPAKFKSFGTVDKDGPSKCTPEQLRAARGMRAVEAWLGNNIDNLFFVEVPLTKDGEPVVDAEGKAVMTKAPAFKPVVNEMEKKIKAFNAHMKAIMESEFTTDAEKEALAPIFKEISDRLVPQLEKEVAAHKTALAALKPAEVAEEKAA